MRMLLCGAGASFMIMLDANIVAVSLPAIARDLHGEFTDVEWVVSAYLLPFAALLMAAGALADRWGRRRVLLWGLACFAVASLMCGMASSLFLLNGARALQAIGAAMQLSAGMAVISHGFEAKERVKVYAIWGTVMGLAPSLGPILGGLITTYFGWRWAFLINLPISAVLFALAVTSIDESRDPKAARLDYAGIFFFGIGLFSVIWGLIAANGVGWESPATLLRLGIGVCLLMIFVFVEQRQTRPMLDFSLFRDRTAVGAAVAMLGYASTAQVMMTILPLYIQDAFGYVPATAGMAMIPFALPLLVAPGVGARLARSISSRAVLTMGLGLVAAGETIIAAAVFGGAGYLATAVGLLVTGSGAGLLNGETTKVQMGTVPPDRAGMASGIATTTRFVGISFGLAGLGAVLAAVAENDLRRLGTPLTSGHAVDWYALSLLIVGGDANRALAELPETVHKNIGSAVRESVASGFGATFCVAVVVALAAAMLTWHLLRPTTLDVQGVSANTR